MRWADRPSSAIGKSQVNSPIDLTPTGFEGDEQADLTVHGGLEKAVHHYPADHYRTWVAELGQNPRFVAGGFGENISTEGLLEADVCIGDIFQIGTARVQVSLGRQPCWKLSAHTKTESMAYEVQRTARTGWYYRVMEPGVVTCGDQFVLSDRRQPKWSVERVTRARFDRTLEATTARELASLPELSASWRDAFSRRIAGEVEDTSGRLDGN